MAEVAGVVGVTFCEREPGVDKICTEMLKVLDAVGMSWLTQILMSHESGRPGWWSPSLGKGTGGCVPTVLLGKSMPRCRKGGYNR